VDDFSSVDGGRYEVGVNDWTKFSVDSCALREVVRGHDTMIECAIGARALSSHGAKEAWEL
jgi:hypothetical protein